MDMKMRMHYKHGGLVPALSSRIRELFNDNDEIVIVNIGTDNAIGDAIGPIVGTLLEESNYNFTVYGSLNDPIHAVNLETRVHHIYKDHPRALIIAVDASVGYEHQIGTITFKDEPLKPGQGVGKKLPPVGDWSIKVCVDDVDNASMFSFNNRFRLGMIYNMAKQVADSIIKGYEQHSYQDNDKVIQFASIGN